MAATSTPSPDPTLLTTTQLLREVESLKSQFLREIVCLREILEARLNGNDTAIELLQATADMFPGRMDEKIAALARVHLEKFISIETQFRERDVRTDQTARDSKTAVDAALQAAKEAVGASQSTSAQSIAKSEAAMDKRMDQIGTLIAAMQKAFDDKVDDLKERQTRMEGKGVGVEVAQKTQQTSSSAMVAIIGTIVGVLSLLAAIAISLVKSAS